MFQLFCNETTVHGIVHYYQRRSKLWKVFWIISTLIAMAMVIYGSYFIFKRWLSNPTSTDFSIFSRDRMLLPHFAFCSDTAMSSANLDEYSVSDNLKQVLNSFVTDKATNVMFIDQEQQLPPPIPEAVWQETRGEYEQLLKTLGASDFNEVMERFLLKCSDVVLGCTLNNQPFNCCADSVYRFLDMSLCFALGSGYQLSLHKGLNVFLNYAPMEAVNFLHPQRSIYTALIFDPTNMNDPHIVIHLPVGKIATIDVELTNIDAVNNPPQYICQDDKQYSKVNCQMECRIKSEMRDQMQNTCHCNNTSQLNMEGLKNMCDPWTMRECPSVVLDEIKYRECVQQHCPLSCKQKKITQTVQINEFNIQTAAIGWNISEAEAAVKLEQSVLVTVQYKALEETVIEQHFSMSFNDVLSELGGQLGFFVGASVLTGVHALVFILDACITSTKTQATSS